MTSKMKCLKSSRKQCNIMDQHRSRNQSLRSLSQRNSQINRKKASWPIYKKDMISLWRPINVTSDASDT